MKVLVATTAGSGHFGPLVPFASVLRDSNHEVVVAAPESFAGAVERAGFEHRAFGDASPDELDAVFSTLSELSWDDANNRVMKEVFGRIDTAAALPGMSAIVSHFEPDLVLRDPTEFSSFVVASRAGVPHVQVSIALATLEERIPGQLAEVLPDLGWDGGVEGLQSGPRVSLIPASFEEGSVPRSREPRRFRDPGTVADTEPMPDWWDGASDPLVYVTFGSVAGGMGMFPDLYRAVIAELAGLPVRVLLTVGDSGDPAVLEPLPSNIHVERWWPQAAVMPHAAAMIGHGGFGTTLAALAGGVPAVVLPLFADQPHNARRVQEVGAGLAVEGGAAAVGELGAALERVLGEGSFRAAAKQFAEEIAALPPTADAVSFLCECAGK